MRLSSFLTIALTGIFWIASAPRMALGQRAVSATELTSSRALAEREAGLARRESILDLMRVRNVDSYTFTMRGATDAEVLHQAKVRALVNTASRLYFDDLVILGRPILEPYVSGIADRFIAQWSVRERHILPDNSLELTVKVGVHVDRFYEDLARMNFVDRPKLKPLVAVMLRESLNSQFVEPSQARPALEQALAINSEMRVESPRMESWGLDLDASSNPNLLLDSRLEAQRWDIDVLVTGEVAMTSLPPQVILFDQRFFVEGRVDLKLYRVDNGRLLRTASDRYSASGATQREAVDSLLEVMMPRVAARLTLVGDDDIVLSRPLINAMLQAAVELDTMDVALAGADDRELDRSAIYDLTGRIRAAARGGTPPSAALMSDMTRAVRAMRNEIPTDQVAQRARANEVLFELRGLLPEDFSSEWGNTMLDRTDYRLMIQGATPEMITSIENKIRALSPSVRTYVKSHFGDIAVLNVVFPNARPGQVERFLFESRTPQFRVIPVDDRHFELIVI